MSCTMVSFTHLWPIRLLPFSFMATFLLHYLNIPPFLCPSTPFRVPLPSFSMGGCFFPFSPPPSPSSLPLLSLLFSLPPSPRPLICLHSMCLPFTKFHSKELSRTNAGAKKHRDVIGNSRQKR